MKIDRLDEALYALEMIGRNTNQSDTQKDIAIQKQYEYIIHVLCDEVYELRKSVRTLFNYHQDEHPDTI